MAFVMREMHLKGIP